MNPRLLKFLPLLCLLAPTGAFAAISCTVSSSGFTSVYSTGIATANDSQGTYTVSCLRSDLVNDPITLAYTLRANNGANSSGGRNYARNGTGAANRVEYEVYTNASYSTAWGTTLATSFSGTVNFGSTSTASASHSQTFYARIPALQNVNAKTFPDTVTLTLCNAAGTSCTGAPYGTTGTLAVSVITTTSCQLSTPPSSMNFSYTSFQASAGTASSNYAVRCTNGVSYTPSLDSTSGTMLGLTYTLTLSNPGAATANGLPQSYTINGTIPSGLAGTCANPTCTASQSRTLTITY